jgi:hypothetical protein
VPTAREWAADAVLKALVTNGVDVVAVAHAGRTVTAAQRAALEERDPTCVVPGCATRVHASGHPRPGVGPRSFGVGGQQFSGPGHAPAPAPAPSDG